MEKKQHRQQELEEQYDEEVQRIRQQQKKLNEQFIHFRRETGRLVEKVMHFTKNDSWNNRRFYQVMEQNNRVIRQAKNHYMQQLEEKARDQTPPRRIRKISRIEKAHSYIEIVEIKKHCIVRIIIKKVLITTHGSSCQ